MEGRWEIFICTGCGGATGRHNDCDAIREKTPVVPCDDAAIERAARAMHDVDPWVYGQDEDGEDIHKPWESAPESVQGYYRESAQAAFKAAAGG